MKYWNVLWIPICCTIIFLSIGGAPASAVQSTAASKMAANLWQAVCIGAPEVSESLDVNIKTVYSANVFQASQSLVFGFRGAPGKYTSGAVTDWRDRPRVHGTFVPPSRDMVIPTLPLG